MKTLILSALLSAIMLSVGCSGSNSPATPIATSAAVAPAAPAGSWTAAQATFLTLTAQAATKWNTGVYTWFVTNQGHALTTNFDHTAALLVSGGTDSVTVNLSENLVVGKRYLVYFQSDKAPNEFDLNFGGKLIHLNSFNASGNEGTVIVLGTAEYHNGPTNDTKVTVSANSFSVTRWVGMGTNSLTIGYFRILQDSDYQEIRPEAVALYNAYMALAAYTNPDTAPTALWTTWNTEVTNLQAKLALP